MLKKLSHAIRKQIYRDDDDLRELLRDVRRGLIADLREKVTLGSKAGIKTDVEELVAIDTAMSKLATPLWREVASFLYLLAFFVLMCGASELVPLNLFGLWPVDVAYSISAKAVELTTRQSLRFSPPFLSLSAPMTVHNASSIDLRGAGGDAGIVAVRGTLELEGRDSTLTLEPASGKLIFRFACSGETAEIAITGRSVRLRATNAGRLVIHEFPEGQAAAGILATVEADQASVAIQSVPEAPLILRGRRADLRFVVAGSAEDMHFDEDRTATPVESPFQSSIIGGKLLIAATGSEFDLDNLSSLGMAGAAGQFSADTTSPHCVSVKFSGQATKVELGRFGNMTSVIPSFWDRLIKAIGWAGLAAIFSSIGAIWALSNWFRNRPNWR